MVWRKYFLKKYKQKKQGTWLCMSPVYNVCREGWCSQLGLLAEIALEQAFEASAVACLVLGHLVYGIVDCIEVEGLGCLGDVHLAGACSALGLGTFLQIGLCVPYAVAYELGYPGCMVCLLEGVASERLGDFGIAFAVGLTRHGKVHAYLAALAGEVGLESLHNLVGASLGYADDVLGDVLALALYLGELLTGYTALWTSLGC